MYLTPTLQFLWGAFVKHEPVPTTELAGFVLVWLALAIFTADLYRRNRVGRSASRR
jgi:chloramphenicol-sensitive protein RarD